MVLLLLLAVSKELALAVVVGDQVLILQFLAEQLLLQVEIMVLVLVVDIEEEVLSSQFLVELLLL